MVLNIAVIAVIVLGGYGLYCCTKLIKRIERWMKEIREHIRAIYYFVSEMSLRSNMNEAAHGEVIDKTYELNDNWTHGNPIICHALGEIDGILFTESLEAFEKHYKQGSRIFEADFALTSDGEPVVLHDWEKVRSRFVKAGSKGSKQNVAGDTDCKALQEPMTKEEFSNLKICGKYTTLNVERLIALMDKYQDAYMIVSTKTVNREYDESVRRIFCKIFEAVDRVNPALKTRLILHAYSFRFYYAAMGEFPFCSAIYRLYYYLHPEVLVKELKRAGLTTVTVFAPDKYWFREYQRVLYDNGIKVIEGDTSTPAAAYKRWQHRWNDMVMTPYGEEIRK